MKYNLNFEVTPEETRMMLDLAQSFIPILARLVEGHEEAGEEWDEESDDVPEGYGPEPAPAPWVRAGLEPEEGPPRPTTVPPDGHHASDFWSEAPDRFRVVGSRQEDTPEAYGKPLEFEVAPARTPEEREAARQGFADFMSQWCSPFSSDLPDSEVTFPDRAKIIEKHAGTLLEGQVKQYIALCGSVNRAVYEWLCACPPSSDNFSAEDTEKDLEVLADSISGTIAQLASIMMPELLVVYDISPSWRKHIKKETDNG